jgi:glutamate dehydrogenase/leucine dehydrogenase
MTTGVATRADQPGARTLSTGFGVLMVAVAAVGAHGTAVVVSVLALAAVVAGLGLRAAATAAVLLTVVVLAVSDSPPLVAALSGLSAAAYLLLRHAAGAGVITMTKPTLIAMLAFTLAGVVATAVNLDLPWLPLLAPPAVVAIYVLALIPHTRT